MVLSQAKGKEAQGQRQPLRLVPAMLPPQLWPAHHLVPWSVGRGHLTNARSRFGRGPGSGLSLSLSRRQASCPLLGNCTREEPRAAPALPERAGRVCVQALTREAHKPTQGLCWVLASPGLGTVTRRRG